MSEAPNSGGSGNLGDEFDRTVRRFEGLQDAVKAGPSNERILSAIINLSQDWTVTTYREKVVRRNSRGESKVAMEDTILLTKGEGSVFTRLVIPPKIAAIIARQYDAVSGKNRKRAARETYENRVAAGDDPAERLRKGKKR